MSEKRGDVILADGTYARGLNADEIATLRRKRNGSAVRAYLPLRGIYRLPLLGIFARNRWAKRNGAIHGFVALRE